MAYDALRTILPIAGWPEDKLRQVDITGGADPILPTPFRIGAAGAAALAATGLAAADLWELRTGRRQEVAVDLRQAVASLRSGHYLQDRRRRDFDRAQPGDGRLSGEKRPLELHPRQFPEPPRRRDERARLSRKSARRCARPWRNGTRSNSKRRSSPPRVRAAWCAAWRNGQSIRRRPRSPRCR